MMKKNVYKKMYISTMKRILMVCLGNICRSPVAEGIMKDKAKKYKLDIVVASAGTSGFHEGEAPDKRSTLNALEHGVDIRSQKSRPLRKDDFERFDLIFTMDESNFTNALNIGDKKHHSKVKMILNEVHPNSNKPVPDPYFGNDGFEEVFQLLDEACEIIALKLKNNEY